MAATTPSIILHSSSISLAFLGRVRWLHFFSHAIGFYEHSSVPEITIVLKKKQALEELWWHTFALLNKNVLSHAPNTLNFGSRSKNKPLSMWLFASSYTLRSFLLEGAMTPYFIHESSFKRKTLQGMACCKRYGLHVIHRVHMSIVILYWVL